MNKLAFSLFVVLFCLPLAPVRAELPFGAEAAREMGIQLPRPFGVSWTYMDQSQPFKVTSLSVSSGAAAVPATIQGLVNEDVSKTGRVDLWLLPFLNVYALGGTTRNLSRGEAAIPPGIVGPEGTVVPFRQRYEGDVAGLGILLAMGSGSVFSTIDFNYTETDISISDDDAKAMVIAQRVGWQGSAGVWKGAIWVGAMFQDIQQTLEIDTEFMGVPVTARVEEKAAHPWNVLLGASWYFNSRLWVAIEGGVGEREQWMGSAGLRF